MFVLILFDPWLTFFTVSSFYLSPIFCVTSIFQGQLWHHSTFAAFILKWHCICIPHTHSVTVPKKIYKKICGLKPAPLDRIKFDDADDMNIYNSTSVRARTNQPAGRPYYHLSVYPSGFTRKKICSTSACFSIFTSSQSKKSVSAQLPVAL